jgi:hypothetical protein
MQGARRIITYAPAPSAGVLRRSPQTRCTSVSHRQFETVRRETMLRFRTLMNLRRTATLALVGAALAVCTWLAAAATISSREPIVTSVVRAPPVDQRGAALADEIARLHERLRPSAVPLQPGRDLFAYSRQQGAAPPPAPPPPPPRQALTEAPILRPPAVAMRLSGIAEDVTPDGVVRTAIISGFGQLFIVKEGERVLDRYRVAKISAEAVELSDLDEGAVVRLALR